MTDGTKAQKLAARTEKWANTMAKVQFSKHKTVPQWQWVKFLGPNKRESAGIVDVLLIRKDHREPPKGLKLKRGDLFEIILLQIKGGSAPWPSSEDIKRLRIVRRRYGAKAIVLTHWGKGRMPDVYELKKTIRTDVGVRDAWKLLPSPQELLRR